MKYKPWEQWGLKPKEQESTLVDRSLNKLPEMESTKQLVRLVSETYQPGMKVLDVGCNVGHYLRGLRRINSHLDYTGVDAYEHYIKKAKEIFKEDQYARFEVRNLFEPIFQNNSFDIVFCCNVILHLPDFRTPVKNLLNVTKKVCLIRTLLGENTTIVKKAKTEKFDDAGKPLDFLFQNTWDKKYFIDFVEKLGWKVEVIPDEFEPSILQKEHQSLKKGEGTRILDGKQVDGNIIYNWTWVKITSS